jgi:hypothetical protein
VGLDDAHGLVIGEHSSGQPAGVEGTAGGFLFVTMAIT